MVTSIRDCYQYNLSVVKVHLARVLLYYSTDVIGQQFRDSPHNSIRFCARPNGNITTITPSELLAIAYNSSESYCKPSVL